MHRIVHTEFCSSEPKKTADAFAQLFGWKITPMDMGGTEYILWSYPDDDNNGGGGIFKGTESWTGPTTIENIEVENIQNTITKATKLGSKIVTPETAIGPNGEHGYFASLVLPGDCRIGIWAKNASK
jgi:predicted enzyme related to lactoylglutathione lyase